MDNPGFQIENIGAVTFYIGQISSYQFSQVMLGNNFNGKEIFENYQSSDVFSPLQ